MIFEIYFGIALGFTISTYFLFSGAWDGKSESGNGINKQSIPILMSMLTWLFFIYLPIFLYEVGLI